jgi:hypothetical protein
MALGGGAYAAASSDTKQDKKIANGAAKTYFNNNIGGASVSHANTANSAISATSATNATTASNAANAVNASNAAALGGVPASGYATVAQGAFTAATLSAGYSNFGGGYSPAGYEKDSLGFVHLRGLMNCPAGQVVAFNLPAGFRPALGEVFTAPVGNTAAGTVYVLPDGRVYTDLASASFCSVNIPPFPAAGVAGTSRTPARVSALPGH